MSITLKIFLIMFLILQLILIIYTVKKKNMTMKYASLWIVLILLMAIIAVFPELIFKISKLFGFEKTSNMVFLIGFSFLFYISVILTTTISSQNEKIKILTQEISLLKGSGNSDGKRE